MGGFALIDNNKMIILVNEVEKAIEINPQEVQDTFSPNKVLRVALN